jgi:hypothetical protein
MALQSKTLLNDVGSAVLAETVSQLNRASGYVAGPTMNNTTGGLTVDATWIPAEDVLVTDIQFLTVGATDHLDDELEVRVGNDALFTNNTPAFVGPASFAANGLAAGVHSLAAGITGEVTAWSPVAVDAGTRLWFQFEVVAGSTQTLLDGITFTYRPVKDALTLSPNYVQTMRNFSSTAR